MKKKYKLSWVEQTKWEVEVEANSKEEAETKFFAWGDEVDNHRKEGDIDYLEGSLEVEEVE